MNTILQGDCNDTLQTLSSGTVQCVVTSPPYYNLRDYGVDGQIGLEETPEEYVAKLVQVFREVRRVLCADGTLWLNVGDSYASQAGPQVESKFVARDGSQRGSWNGKSRKPADGIKPKDLYGIPWMLAFALRADGWYLRQDIIWAKGNPMPESVEDRPTRSHEYLFLLSKSQHYYYDSDAIREPHVTESNVRNKAQENSWASGALLTPIGEGEREWNHPLGRNKRSVWMVNSHPYKHAHFATMPPKLIEPCILAGSRPGDVVLDPFAGAGTTLMVALQHGRQYIGCELNPDYINLARKRIAHVQQNLWSVEGEVTA